MIFTLRKLAALILITWIWKYDKRYWLNIIIVQLPLNVERATEIGLQLLFILKNDTMAVICPYCVTYNFRRKL